MGVELGELNSGNDWSARARDFFAALPAARPARSHVLPCGRDGPQPRPMEAMEPGVQAGWRLPLSFPLDDAVLTNQITMEPTGIGTQNHEGVARPRHNISVKGTASGGIGQGSCEDRVRPEAITAAVALLDPVLRTQQRRMNPKPIDGECRGCVARTRVAPPF